MTSDTDNTDTTMDFDISDVLPSSFYTMTGGVITFLVAGNYIVEWGFGSQAGATSMRFRSRLRKISGGVTTNVAMTYFQGTGGQYEVYQHFISPKFSMAVNDTLYVTNRRQSGSLSGETWTLANAWLRIIKV